MMSFSRISKYIGTDADTLKADIVAFSHRIILLKKELTSLDIEKTARLLDLNKIKSEAASIRRALEKESQETGLMIDGAISIVEAATREMSVREVALKNKEARFSRLMKATLKLKEASIRRIEKAKELERGNEAESKRLGKEVSRLEAALKEASETKKESERALIFAKGKKAAAVKLELEAAAQSSSIKKMSEIQRAARIKIQDSEKALANERRALEKMKSEIEAIKYDVEKQTKANTSLRLEIEKRERLASDEKVSNEERCAALEMRERRLNNIESIKFGPISHESELLDRAYALAVKQGDLERKEVEQTKRDQELFDREERLLSAKRGALNAS